MEDLALNFPTRNSYIDKFPQISKENSLSKYEHYIKNITAILLALAQRSNKFLELSIAVVLLTQQWWAM